MFYFFILSFLPVQWLFLAAFVMVVFNCLRWKSLANSGLVFLRRLWCLGFLCPSFCWGGIFSLKQLSVFCSLTCDCSSQFFQNGRILEQEASKIDRKSRHRTLPRCLYCFGSRLVSLHSISLCCIVTMLFRDFSAFSKVLLKFRCRCIFSSGSEVLLYWYY